MKQVKFFKSPPASQLIFLPLFLLLIAGSLTARSIWWDEIELPPTSKTAASSLACECSRVTFTKTLEGGNLSSLFPAGYVWWYNETVCVSGTVIVDVDMTLVQCTLYMAPNARLQVTNGKQLLAITNTLFRACSDMWQGIDILAGATLDMESTRVQDAFQGVWLHNGYNANRTKIFNSRFFNNQTGLAVGGDGSGSTPFLIPFYGNVFSTDTPNLLPPLQNETAQTGLLLNRCSPAIISSGSNNSFFNVQKGIGSYFSDLTILDGSFNSNQTFVDDPVSGYGIVSALGFLTVNMCDFNLEKRGGIRSFYDLRLNVGHNQFNHNDIYGIHAEPMASGAAINIHYNQFLMDGQNELAAIRLQRPLTLATNPNGGANQIHRNTITVSGLKNSQMALIDVGTAGGTALGQFVISTNTINNTATHTGSAIVHGIQIGGFMGQHANANGYRIQDNDLNYTSAGVPPVQGSLAIAIIDVTGTGNEVRRNTVLSTLADGWVGANDEARCSWVKCAIHLDNSPGWLFCRNRSDDVYRGNHFASTLGNCDYEANTMTDAYYGMLCEANVTMVNQVLQKNIWNGVYQVNSARFGVAQVPLNASFLFIENVADWPAMGTYQPGNWFVPPTALDVQIITCPATLLLPVPEALSSTEQKLIDGTYPPTTAATEWDDKRDLLLRMLFYPELRPTGSTAAQYFTQHQNSPAGQFAQAEKAWLEAYSSIPSVQSELDSLFEQNRILSLDLLELDSIQKLDTLFDEQIYDDELVIAGQIQAVQTSLRNLQDDLNADIHAALNLVNSQITSLASSSIHETNWKTAYLKAIKVGLGLSLVESDFQELRLIANQCPEIGGEVVRRAALFLPQPEARLYVRDEYYGGVCEQNSHESENRWDLNSDFQLIPNPASDELTVVFDKETEAIQWQLTDLNGRIRKSEKFADAHAHYFSVDIHELPIGVYFFSLETTGGLRLNRLVSILR